MAKGDSHCCHHLGIVKYYPNYHLFVHNSSNLKIANMYYNGANLDLKNVSYLNQFFLYFYSIKAIILKKNIIFSGLHLRQAVFLLPFLIIGNKITIHLHGQSHGLKDNFLKIYLWKFISYYSKLEIGNPAWAGPSFVKVIKNINVLHNPKTSINNNKVLFYSKNGIEPKNIELLRNIFISNNLELILMEPHVSYKILDSYLRSVSYIYIDFCQDYYLYSPSGHISDAINYGLKIILNKSDFFNISVIKNYPVKYILI